MTLAAVLTSLTFAVRAEATTYYACVVKKKGAIRLVGRASRCHRNEFKISLNSQGPPGIPGRNGKNGKNGKDGKNGLNGTNGTNGTSGFAATLPKGATEYGVWAANLLAKESRYYIPISFNIPLAERPGSTIMGKKAAPTVACPGTAASPKAASGQLCIYVAQLEGGAILSAFDPSIEGGPAGPNVFGVILRLASEATPAAAYGTWAVTG